MNKNTLYLAVFTVLCVLAGVLVGATITRKPDFSRRNSEIGGFREKAERFMKYGKEHSRGEKGSNFLSGMLASKLGLNDEQKAKVDGIMENARKEIDELGKTLRSSISDIKEKGDNQIMEILTPEQQEKFRALKSEFEKGHQFMKQRGAWSHKGGQFGGSLCQELPQSQE